MGGLIFWLIIIIWIIVAVSKNKGKSPGQKSGSSQSGRTVVSRSSQSASRSGNSQIKKAATVNSGSDWMDDRYKQQELKARLSKKYNKYGENSQGNILQRAKASVEEDFSTNEYVSAGASGSGAAGSGSGSSAKPVYAGYQNTAQSKQKEMERRIAEKLAAAEQLETERYQQNHVLETVEDLMVKGPDMDLSFERDFLAEGMDMLNRVQGELIG